MSNTTFFAVNPSGETVADSWEDANVNGAMPERLATRVDSLQKRFGEDAEALAAKEQRAAANYKENMENVRRTAAKTNEKAELAAARRDAFGENLQMMGNVMGNKDQPVKLPSALRARLALAPRSNTTAASLDSKQAKAERNRKALLSQRANKAALAQKKVAEARERKEQAQREAVAAASEGRIFEVDVGGADEAVGEQRRGGWGVKTTLPPRLQQRLKKVQAKFDYDVMARYNRNANNHSAKIEAIRAKAAIASERVRAAAQRRALSKGDDNHFTVTLEEDATASAQGWAAKPSMPKHLQNRIETLNARFSDGSTMQDKQARAAANRAAFNNSKKAKAREFGAEDVEKAKARRALAAGDANHFTVTQASFNPSGMTEGNMNSAQGWGRQQGSRLPAALVDRLNEINQSKTKKPDMET